MTVKICVTGGTAKLQVGDWSASAGPGEPVNILGAGNETVHVADDAAAYLSATGGNEAFVYVNGEMVFSTRSRKPVAIPGRTASELLAAI